MRKWWWTGLFALALVPQTISFGQDGEKKPEAEKKAEDDKAEAQKKLLERRREAQARQVKEQKVYAELNKLISDKKFEEAETLLADTVKENPVWMFKPSAPYRARHGLLHRR